MKISDPRKLPSGNYRIQLRLDGKSISITAPTSKECKHKAELIKAEYLNGKRSVPDSSRTLSEAIDKYIKDRNSILSPTTIKGYRAIQRNRFQSVMNRKLSSINDWQSIINKESEKVSAKYIYNAWGLIASVISSERLSVPRVSLPQKIRKERTWLDSGDILKLIEAKKHLIPLISTLQKQISMQNREQSRTNLSNSIARMVMLKSFRKLLTEAKEMKLKQVSY